MAIQVPRCPYCGADNPWPEARYCAQCGRDLTPPMPAPPVSAALPIAPAPRPRRWLGWTAVVVAAGVGSAIGLDWFLGRVQQVGQAYQQLAQAHLAPAPSRPTPTVSQRPGTTAPPATARTSSSPPSQAPATVPSPPPAVAAQVAGYADLITGTLEANTLLFPATVTGPDGSAAVTVQIDTGNATLPIIEEAVARTIGLVPTGQMQVSGVVPGATLTGPTYGAFTVTPSGPYVRGQPGALAVSRGVGDPQLPGNLAQVNLGPSALTQAKLVLDGDRWWFAWNPTRVAPPSTPPATAPPSAAPPSAPPPSPGWGHPDYGGSPANQEYWCNGYVCGVSLRWWVTHGAPPVGPWTPQGQLTEPPCSTFKVSNPAKLRGIVCGSPPPTPPPGQP